MAEEKKEKPKPKRSGKKQGHPVDPNYQKQKQYPSGNEGRLHKGLKLDGYRYGRGREDED